MRTIKVWLFLFLAVIASDAGLAEANAANSPEKNALISRSIQERSKKSNKQVVKGEKANKNFNKANAVNNKKNAKIASSKKPVKAKPVKLVKIQTSKTSLQKKTTIVRSSSRNVKAPVITTTEKVNFSVLEKATSDTFKDPNFMIEKPGNGKYTTSQKTTLTNLAKAVSSLSSNSSMTSTSASSTISKSSTTSTKRVESLLGVSTFTPEPSTSTKGTTMLTKKLENLPAMITSTTTKPAASPSSTSEGPPLLKDLDDPQTSTVAVSSQSKVTAKQISDSSSPTIAQSTSTTTTKTPKAAASLLLPSMMARGVIPGPSGLTQEVYSQINNVDNPTLLRGSGINQISQVSTTSGPADQAFSLAMNQAPNRESTPQVKQPLLSGSKPLLDDLQTSEGAMLVTAITAKTPKTVEAAASISLPPPYMMLRGVLPVALAKSTSNVTVTNNQTKSASSNNTAHQKYGEADSSSSTNDVPSTSTSIPTSTLSKTLTTTTVTPKTINATVNLQLPPRNMMLRGVLPVALAIPKSTANVNVSTASSQTISVVSVPASNNTDAADSDFDE